MLEYIKRHAPFVKTKFTFPPTTWMRQSDIADLQKTNKDSYRFLAHHHPSEEN